MTRHEARERLIGAFLAHRDGLISRDDLLALLVDPTIFDRGPDDPPATREPETRREPAIDFPGLGRAYLESHGGDPRAALDSIGLDESIRERLGSIEDPDLRAWLELAEGDDSLATRDGARLDPYETRVLPEGETVAGGIPGTDDARFQILHEHARGGLGQVFVALDRELNREVALKEIQARNADKEASRARFVLEAEVTGGLEHPGIVPVYSLGVHEDGRPYYAMRFIRGESLATALRRFHQERGEGHAVEFRKLLGRFVAVCNAIAYAHSKGVIHRDIKPDNIMIGKFGETLVVDWGLAKVIGRPEVERDEPALVPSGSGSSHFETLPGSVLGTPQFMSPEQASGDGDKACPRCDIYSLGVILYVLMTGRTPFETHDLIELLDRVRRGEFPTPRSIEPRAPRALEAIALKAMATDPQDRYDSASALAEDVDRFLADEPVLAWREPWTIRAGRWARRHGRLVTGSAAAVLVAVLAGSATVASSRARGIGLVERLQTAEIGRVPMIVEEMVPFRFWTDARLVAASKRLSTNSPERLRVALGLLPVDPAQVDGLVAQALLPSTDPATLKVVRNALGLRRGLPVAAGLWSEMERGGETSQFRAACLLAGLVPRDPAWDRHAARTVAQLLSMNVRDPMAVGEWAKLLAGVLPRFVPILIRTYAEDQTRPADRSLIASLLAEHASRPEDLVTLIRIANLADFPLFLAKIKASPTSIAGRLRDVVAAYPADGSGGEAEARKTAQVAIALARLDPLAPPWDLLRHRDDPGLRSWLIEDFAPLGLPVSDVIRQLQVEPDVAARQALILALGQYDESRLPIARRGEVATSLADRFRTDPDPGIHSAIDWLLRGWNLDGELRRLDRELAAKDASPTGKPMAGRSWFVNSRGRTFAVIREPGSFWMGSPPDEPGRDRDESLHRRSINRSLAIAVAEVTVGEFQEFLDANPKLFPQGDEDSTSNYCREPSQPRNGVSFYHAAAYCRWLSEREGYSEEDMCFPPLADIVEAFRGGSPLKLPSNLLRRSGYRLPTEPEWEWACRHGTRSSRPHGSGEALLPRYTWAGACGQGGIIHEGGELKPSDLGLFDMLGNLREICLPPLEDDYPTEPDGTAIEDPILDVIVPKTDCPTRGGSVFDLPPSVRSAHRSPCLADDSFLSTGFRLARTLPSAHIRTSRIR